MTENTTMSNRELWQQIADNLNELADRGVRITTGIDSTYIGPNFSLDRPGVCVVSVDDRWGVEDWTPRCAECTEPVGRPGMTYCSQRCRNAADRHDQDVEVDA